MRIFIGMFKIFPYSLSFYTDFVLDRSDRSVIGSFLEFLAISRNLAVNWIVITSMIYRIILKAYKIL